MSQYATYRGVSRAAVSKAVKSGRISVIDEDGKRLVDSDAADKEWAKNSDISKKTTPTKAEKNLTHAAREAADSDFSGVGSPQQPALKPSMSAAGVGDFNTNKTIKEYHAAKLAELDYKERTGQLISAESVRESAFKLGRQIREAIMNIPIRISSELAAESDENKVYERLTDELRQALEELAGA